MSVSANLTVYSSEHAKAVHDVHEKALAALVHAESAYTRDDLQRAIGMSFEGQREAIRELLALLELVEKAPLEAVPPALLLRFKGEVETAYDALEAARTYESGARGEQDRRNDISNVSERISKSHGSLRSASPPIVALAHALTHSQITGSIDERVSSTIAAGSAAINQQLAKATEETDRLTRKGEEMDRVLAAAKERLQEGTIADHARRFDAEAKTHGKAATGWLIATAILAFVTLGTAVFVVFWYVPAHLATDGAQAAQLAIGKLVLFSVLISAVLWAGRVYRSHRHNEVVNRHRANALNSYEAFAIGAHDPEVKSAVLVQVAQSIFAPQHTGFVSQESEPTPASHIVELYRSTGGKGA